MTTYLVENINLPMTQLREFCDYWQSVDLNTAQIVNLNTAQVTNEIESTRAQNH